VGTGMTGEEHSNFSPAGCIRDHWLRSGPKGLDLQTETEHRLDKHQQVSSHPLNMSKTA